jgi:hypothetical protein
MKWRFQGVHGVNEKLQAPVCKSRKKPFLLLFKLRFLIKSTSPQSRACEKAICARKMQRGESGIVVYAKRGSACEKRSNQLPG